MKYLKKFNESKEEINIFIEDYIGLDLEDDNFTIRYISIGEFINQKYKNIGSSSNRTQEVKSLMFNQNVHLLSISKISGFNLYDIETHIRRLLDMTKLLGYNNFEIRKITQMSRKSLEVTQSFLSNRKLPKSSKREIIALHILLRKERLIE